MSDPSVGHDSHCSVADQCVQTRRFIPNRSPVMNRIYCIINSRNVILNLSFWFFNSVHLILTASAPGVLLISVLGQQGAEWLAASSRLPLPCEGGLSQEKYLSGGDMLQPVKGIKSKNLLPCLIGQILPCGVQARDVKEEECVCSVTALMSFRWMLRKQRLQGLDHSIVQIVICCAASYHFKPVWCYFFCGTQKVNFQDCTGLFFHTMEVK